LDPVIDIRHFKSDELEKVIALFRLNTPAFFSLAEEDDLHHYLQYKVEQYFVVYRDNRLIGCGGINLLDNGTTGRLSWDFFDPAFQGKGYGTLLLRHRLSVLTTKRVGTIEVRTSQHACNFYGKNGFELKEIIHDFWAPGFHLYRMEYAGHLIKK
jgi:GNAT superfamily N-acetyltransferase